MKKATVCFFILLLFAGCSSAGSRQYRGVSFFTKDIDLSVPLEKRIQTAQADVISWLISFGLSDNYRPYMPQAEEKRLFAGYAQLLPDKFRQTMKEKVIAIFFIENFEGGGMTMHDFDRNGNMYMVLFFNPEILRRTLSEWINLRENSYFEDAPGVTVAAECSGNYYALLHTLTHEASHVYDFYHHATPFTEPELQSKGAPLKTDFTDTVWEAHSRPLEDYDFPHRGELFAWGLGPVQSKSLAMDIYRSLLKTPFASLYGAQNWAEDFAETFTWFYLERYLGVTYRFSVKKNDGINEETQLFEPVLNPLLKARYNSIKAICD